MRSYLTVTTFVTAITQVIVNLTKHCIDFENPKRDLCKKKNSRLSQTRKIISGILLASSQNNLEV